MRAKKAKKKEFKTKPVVVSLNGTRREYVDSQFWPYVFKQIASLAVAGTTGYSVFSFAGEISGKHGILVELMTTTLIGLAGWYSTKGVVKKAVEARNRRELGYIEVT